MGFYKSILASHRTEGIIRALLTVIAMNLAEMVKNQCKLEGSNLGSTSITRWLEEKEPERREEERTRRAKE